MSYYSPDAVVDDSLEQAADPVIEWLNEQDSDDEIDSDFDEDGEFDPIGLKSKSSSSKSKSKSKKSKSKSYSGYSSYYGGYSYSSGYISSGVVVYSSGGLPGLAIVLIILVTLALICIPLIRWCHRQ